MTLTLRARFAMLAGLLVLLVASMVGVVGYLTFRSSVLDRAASTARAEAARLVMLASGNGDGQTVDMTDSSLTRQLSAPGLRVEVDRSNGAVVQSTPAAHHRRVVALTAELRSRCLTAGQAQARLSSPPLAVACARLGAPHAPLATIAVGVPLQDSLASLATLRRALILGVLGGGVLAAALSLLLARRALRPLKRIALAAETIRSGDLTRRIDYGAGDELGQLARVLDACFGELEDAIERQRRFAADASHELRTPLAAIRANVEVLQGWGSADPAAREAALESVEQAARRASQLVADLLALVRLDREPVRSLTRVHLDEVLLGAVREATPLRREVAVRVIELDDVILEAGDPIGLQQVLLNVSENALLASPPGGEVAVSLAATAKQARVTVRDSGPGIAPSDLERIFDRFYTSKVGGEAHRGSGLGLAIARAIARAHGGDLIARNNPDAGATFVLTLPVAADSRTAHEPGPSTDERDRGTASGAMTGAPVSLG